MAYPLRIIELRKFLPPSFTRPFIATTNTGEIVVKAHHSVHKNINYGKILLNEYIAGTFANLIGLPWPKTALAVLDDSIIEGLKQSLELLGMDCVSLSYVNGIKEVPFPDPPVGSTHWDFIKKREEFRVANKNHLNEFFNDAGNISAFYGKALFDVCLFFQDTKYTLFIQPDGKPIFLDGSHALNGETWNFQDMDYSKYNPSFPASPCLEGILERKELYEAWFRRIEELQDEKILSVIEAIPSSWKISGTECKFLRKLLTDERKNFVRIWREKIKYS